MSQNRAISRYTAKAISLLGQEIKLGRRQHRWTESDLADRAGISRATLQKIEKGVPTVAIGIVFEVATLVGIKIFEERPQTISFLQGRVQDKLAILPRRIRKSKRDVDDNF